MNFSTLIPEPKLALKNSVLERPDWTIDSKRDEKKIWLDKNENIDPELNEFHVSLLSKINRRALNTYPNLFPLYKKLSKYTKTPINTLIMTPGSDGVIRLVFEAFINEGDAVLHTNPTFAMYPVYCKMYGAKAYTLDYTKKNNAPYLDYDEVLSKLENIKPKLLCLPNPDSPTGTAFTSEQMRNIIKKAGNIGTLVLVDEAYYEFFNQTTADLVLDHKNLVVARTFAKGWGLAGLRAGYAIASPNIALNLHKVRPMYEINTFAVYFLEEALEYEELMRKSVDRILHGREYFKDKMNSLGFQTLNNHGNFQHVSFGNRASKIHEGLISLVYYRPIQGGCLESFSRFSATTKDIFAIVANTIEGILR